ncbi:hypothetical protein L1O03_02030 [Corynebacterium uropygiale]|uniref:Uncharacterized protein n=1 Tax=Corynebacterium uropygiale TaxID=1775911 RepID=A0A9X1QS16_9CORY|nr:hypothetical protein [Corynebacterium uropygiale]MCF4005955.1 hypothetical protein [Corynebacterium uropygiale]
MGDGTLHVDVEQTASALKETRELAAQHKDEHMGSPPDFPSTAAGQGFAECGEAIREALLRVHEAAATRWSTAHAAMDAAMRDVHQLGAQDEEAARGIRGLDAHTGGVR